MSRYYYYCYYIILIFFISYKLKHKHMSPGMAPKVMEVENQVLGQGSCAEQL